MASLKRYYPSLDLRKLFLSIHFFMIDEGNLSQFQYLLIISSIMFILIIKYFSSFLVFYKLDARDFSRKRFIFSEYYIYVVKYSVQNNILINGSSKIDIKALRTYAADRNNMFKNTKIYKQNILFTNRIQSASISRNRKKCCAVF